MSYPKTKNKYKKKSFSSVKKYVKHKILVKEYPKKIKAKTIIICYSEYLMNYVKNRYETKQIKKFYGDLYLIKNTNNNIGILGNFGIGAPAITTLMEELVYYGVREFISIGEAGGLQNFLNINDIVICEKSIRDEGASYHYIKPSKYSYSDKKLNKELKKYFKNHKIQFHIGAGWTIDTPYRESKKEIKKFQKQGILTVDMEASAIFALAQSKGVKATSVFIISDILVGKNWKQDYRKTQKTAQMIFDIIVKNN